MTSSSSLGKSMSSNSIVNRMLSKDTAEASSSSGIMASKSTSSVVANGHHNSSSSKMADGEVEGEVLLPCEFCEEMIPMFKLLSHQG